MGVWILVFDHAAWPLAAYRTIDDKNCTVTLVAPRFGQAKHLDRHCIPFRIRVLRRGMRRTRGKAQSGGADSGFYQECATAGHDEIARRCCVKPQRLRSAVGEAIRCSKKLDGIRCTPLRIEQSVLQEVVVPVRPEPSFPLPPLLMIAFIASFTYPRP
jgi:hypothetical protein